SASAFRTGAVGWLSNDRLGSTASDRSEAVTMRNSEAAQKRTKLRRFGPDALGHIRREQVQQTAGGDRLRISLLHCRKGKCPFRARSVARGVARRRHRLAALALQ